MKSGWIISIALLLSWAATSSAQTESKRALTLNQPLKIESAISHNKERSDQEKATPIQNHFQFTGQKGEYIELHCRQNGCDVRLHIFAPDNRALATIDSFNGAFGPEHWRAVLPESGAYLVRVEQLTSRVANANYQIELAVKRAANEQDRTKTQAQDLYCQAWLRRQAGTQRDIDEAYYIYEESIELYRRANDTLGEAQALESQAALGRPTLTPRFQANLYQSALALYNRMREPSGQATTLHNLGTIFSEYYKLSDAIAFFKKALDVHRQLGDQRSEAIALNNIAIAYLRLDQPQEALRYYQQALAVCRKSGDRTGEAALLKYIGELYQEQLNQPNIAERYFKEAAEIK